MKKLPLASYANYIPFFALLFFFSCASGPKIAPTSFEHTQQIADAHKSIGSGGGVEAKVIAEDPEARTWSVVYTNPVDYTPEKVYGNQSFVQGPYFQYTKRTYTGGFKLVQVQYALKVSETVAAASLENVQPNVLLITDWAVVPNTVQTGDVLNFELGPVSATEEVSGIGATKIFYSLTSPRAPAPKVKKEYERPKREPKQPF